MDPSASWEHVKADIFWGEVADCKHIVQIYETDEVFIDALAGFTMSGFEIEDCCIIIATQAHLKLLNDRLASAGWQIDELIAAGKYMPHVADDLLSKCIKNGHYDESLFLLTASGVMTQARNTKRVIRMFGETSGLLFARGYHDAAFAMEHMANKFCVDEAICLFCAYSKESFEKEKQASLDHICAEHSKMISGSAKQLTDIYYRDIATV